MARSTPVTVWLPPRTDGLVGGVGDADRLGARAEGAVLDRLCWMCERVVGVCVPLLEIRPTVVRCDAGRALVRTVSGPGDLLVVGRAAGGRLRANRTGRTASYCVAHAPCAVLVAPVSGHGVVSGEPHWSAGVGHRVNNARL